MADSCKHGNEPSSSTKFRAFLDYLRNYYFLKKDDAPWRKSVNFHYRFKQTRYEHSAMEHAVALGDSTSFIYSVQRNQNCSNITERKRNDTTAAEVTS